MNWLRRWLIEVGFIGDGERYRRLIDLEMLWPILDEWEAMARELITSRAVGEGKKRRLRTLLVHLQQRRDLLERSIT